MAMPWLFSCRRFVAPTWLQHLRGPQDSRVAVPLEAGKYIAIYWINEGRLDDHEQWSLGANYRLHAEGREPIVPGLGAPLMDQNAARQL